MATVWSSGLCCSAHVAAGAPALQGPLCVCVPQRLLDVVADRGVLQGVLLDSAYATKQPCINNINTCGLHPK